MENTVIDNFDFEQNENENNQNPEDVNQTSKGKLRFTNLSTNQRKTLLKGGSGLAVLMLGAGALMAFSNKEGEIVTDTDNGFDNFDDNSNEYADNFDTEDYSTEAVEVTFDAPIATAVNNEMNFSEAFQAAREEIGAGGFFMHNNQVFNTYYKEEWDAMSKEDKEAYVNSIADHVESVETIEIEPSNFDNNISEPIANEPDNVAEIEQETEDIEPTVEPMTVTEEVQTTKTDIEENKPSTSEVKTEDNSDSIEPSEVEDIEPVEPVVVPSENIVEEVKTEESVSLEDIPNELEDLIFGTDKPNEEDEVVEMEAIDSNAVNSEFLTQENETIIVDEMDIEPSEESTEVAEIDEEEIAKSIEFNSDEALEVDVHSEFVYNEETEELVFSSEIERDYEELPDDMVTSLETENELEDELNFETTNEIEIDELPEDSSSNDLSDDVSDLDLF